MNTEQEYIAYLNQNPRAREIQFLIHLELSKVRIYYIIIVNILITIKLFR